MFEGLREDQLAGALEALLFVTDEPVSALVLADMLQCDPERVQAELDQLRSTMAADNRGIQLREVAGGWRLYTHPAFHELIEKYVVSWDTRKLSAAALETLAVVAYTQPATRASVASVRGVNSDSPLNSLVEKGLVREAGTADAPGNPTLYVTTRTFLEKFGLRSVEDLPAIEDFAPDEETRRLIASRLSASRETVGVSDEEARLMAEGLYEDNPALIDEAAFDTTLESLDEALDASQVADSSVLEDAAEDEIAAALGQRHGETIVMGDAEADAQVALRNPAMDGFPSATYEPIKGEVSEETAQVIAAQQRSAQELVEAREALEVQPGDAAAAQSAATQAMFARAIASTLGVVDKINFDELTFETDDE